VQPKNSGERPSDDLGGDLERNQNLFTVWLFTNNIKNGEYL
jgi:hypothetical protein